MDTGDDIEFQSLGLRHFFEETADGETDWDGFFKDPTSLDLQMPSFIRGDETEHAEELFLKKTDSNYHHEHQSFCRR